MAHSLDNAVVTVINGAEITRGTLAATFALVEDSANWKNPIDKLVTYEQAFAMTASPLALIREAVVFFAGCVPTVEHVAGGLRVRAAGYYAAVGA